MKKFELMEELPELSNEELLLVEGGGIIKDIFKKVGDAYDQIRDCINGCGCKGCSDPGLRNTVRYLM
ncbi:hypothetical protein [Runella sp.]|jgi:hypothetical protein|uniref:hypothetical protein n=1 Tax=Runella sp. TaxID=1960881 RepID=UPI0026081D39|nr:hypothetical protein [Runella sp.]